MDDPTEIDFMHSWRPSDDLMRELHGEALKPTPVGGELRAGTLHSHVDTIPSHVRESTPDSVTSLGKVLLKSGPREEKYVDTGNLQKNAKNRTNNTSINLAESTRELVYAMTLANGTARTSRYGENIEMFGSQNEADEYAAREEPEKNRHFVPKCLLFLVTLMIVLAGVVALIVVADKEEPVPRGQIVPDPITHDECESRSFYLGDLLNFTCIFDTSHEYRKILKDAKYVTVIPKGKVSTNRSLSYESPDEYEDLDIVVFNITTDSRARCSSAGTYDVIFKNESKNIIHSSRVSFTIKASSLTTTMTQRALTGSRCLDTEFDVTCNIQNDCNSYHTTLYRRQSGQEESLSQYLNCIRSYTDDDGYIMNCSASLPDTLIENYVNLGCRIEAVLPNNERLMMNAPFKLPDCGVEPKCYTRDPDQEAFNCSQKSSDFKNLLNANCDSKKLKKCLTPGRLVFSANKDKYDNLTCSDNRTVPVCRLSWCKDFSYVRKNEILGEVICQGFTEPYVSPTTTTSTSIKTSTVSSETSTMSTISSIKTSKTMTTSSTKPASSTMESNTGSSPSSLTVK